MGNSCFKKLKMYEEELGLLHNDFIKDAAGMFNHISVAVSAPTMDGV